MANVKECDRCKSTYPIDYSKQNDFTALMTRRGTTYGTYDLCPKCEKELENWFTNKGEFDNTIA